MFHSKNDEEVYYVCNFNVKISKIQSEFDYVQQLLIFLIRLLPTSNYFYVRLLEKSLLKSHILCGLIHYLTYLEEKEF